MTLFKGNLRSLLITESHTSFSLKGKICPTFQNEGTAYVVIDGRKLLPGESYSTNLPLMICQNNVPITFEGDPSKTKILYIGFGEQFEK
jgi:hypothetical protein